MPPVIKTIEKLLEFVSLAKEIAGKKISKEKLITIGVGDNFNDLDMLKNSDIPCLVFNDKFTMEKINIDNCLVSKKPAPEGWEEVVKLALDKIK